MCTVLTNSTGATCLVVSPAEREQGGSSKVVEAMPVLKSDINKYKHNMH